MARQPATRLQLSGHRFLLRRTAHALVRGDARMLDDPLRAQAIAFTAGGVLAVVAITACAVLALVRPGGELADAPILLARNSGALYVRIGDTIHPVPNLASARLVVGAAADPVPVSDDALARARRGPQVGIPGAPTQIDSPLSIDESAWAVCDIAEPVSTTLVVGALSDRVAPLRHGQALLVAPRGEPAATTYLLFDGWRAAVDLRDLAVTRALRLDGLKPTGVSRALLDSVPEAPAIRAPAIAGAGLPGPAALRGVDVGSVVRVRRAGDTDEFYVVLAGGVQRVGRVAADLIRFTVAQPAAEPPVVSAQAIARVPVVEDLAVARVPQWVDAHARPVLCAGWDPRQPSAETNTTLYAGDSLPETGLRLAQADEAGPAIDRVDIPAGRSALVRATGIDGGIGVAGPRYLLNDLGVLFGIHDDTAAEHLGLTRPAVLAPWPMLAMLPRGPELSRDAASVAHDGLTSRGWGS
ncbi:type VII secretion protein [Mycolicibacterium wolinskyi]|uniref:Type VII secretion protein n=1 Tax=Mycolicibacterium wolinskyi TaxID=59750 RepID=A0A132PU57_9MYCO|nr:type VII secretion protein EccB [Mycolicibacterium wolinskyi]KWX25879.1 type VII secretion protein [Mycolicibacterium wolinskyi]